MVNKFTFHSVGQGLFYTGQLECYPYHGIRNDFVDSFYNFVYDCGS